MYELVFALGSGGGGGRAEEALLPAHGHVPGQEESADMERQVNRLLARRRISSSPAVMEDNTDTSSDMCNVYIDQ